MKVLDRLRKLHTERSEADEAIKALQKECKHPHVVMTFYLGQCNDSSWEMRCLDCGQYGESRENAVYTGEDTTGNLKGKPTLELENEEFLKRFGSQKPYVPLSEKEIKQLGEFKIIE